MPLSKQTTDQIRKEAEDAYPIHHTESISKESLREFQSYHFAKRQGYEAGATAWAVWKEKAEGAKAALESVNDILKVGGHIFPGSEASTKIKKALEQFH